MIDVLSWIFAVIGCAFLLISAVGLFRMPDFFSRTHVASLTDTIGPIFILVALLLWFGWNFKLAAIGILLLFINPATTHALCQAAHDHLPKDEGDNA